MEYPIATLVPLEKRIEIYKEAIESLKKEDDGLCLLLPCLLWKIHYLDNAPCGNDWSYEDTTIMFPEIKSYIIKIYSSKNQNETRIKSLEEILVSLHSNYI